MKVRFYVLMAVTMAALLGNAIWQTLAVQDREDAAGLQRFETLSPHECAVRFAALQEVLSGKAKDWNEYFTVVRQANLLEGAARKAAASEAASHFNTNDRDEFVMRDIPVRIRPLLTQYQVASDPTLRALGNDAYKKAYEHFARAGGDSWQVASIAVPGSERLVLWWFLFHVGAMPFIFIHYCIRIREHGMKVRYELIGNPAFPMWLFAWEIGIFRYPRKVNIVAQLRRAQRWAAFVLSSVIPCFAAGATGTSCEKSPVRYSFSSGTFSQYPGLEGAVFYPYPVQQSSFTVFLPCGMYAGVWNSEPLRHRDIQPNYGTEGDITIGWSGSAKKNTLDVGGTYLDVSPFFKVPRGDVFQFSERMSRTLPLGKGQHIAPYLWFREAYPVRGSTPIGGWFVHGGAIVSGPVGRRFANSADLEVMRDSGAFGYNPGVIGRFLDVPSWKRGAHVAVQLPITVQTPLSHTGDTRRTNVTVGASLVFSY